MIAARKSALFLRWFSGDAEKRLRTSFARVRIRGLDNLRTAIASGPVLVVTNHTAWWDPLVAIVITNRIVKTDSYAMMDAKNLERLPFFGKVGAFGVSLDDPSDGARAMRYAAKLLSGGGGSNRLVWIFAQGREVPITVRPLGFRPGSGEIARLARAAVVPGALRYEMGNTPEPTLWISFGTPIQPIRDPSEAREAHEAAVTTELDRIEASLVGDDGAQDFTTVYEKRPSRLFAIAESILSWLTRPRNASPENRLLEKRTQERDRKDNVGDERPNEASSSGK